MALVRREGKRVNDDRFCFSIFVWPVILSSKLMKKKCLHDSKYFNMTNKIFHIMGKMIVQY